MRAAGCCENQGEGNASFIHRKVSLISNTYNNIWNFFHTSEKQKTKNVGKTTVRKPQVTSKVDKNDRSTKNNLA